MENNQIKEPNTLNGVLDELIAAYAARDNLLNFSDWLQDILQDKLPDLDQDASAKLAGDIVDSIENYDQSLRDLNAAVDAGCPKEDWLVDQLEEAWAELSTEEAGKHLENLEETLGPDCKVEQSANGDIVDHSQWNRYSLRSKARDIAIPAIYAVLGIATKTVLLELENKGQVVLDEALKSAVQDGVTTTPHEVKAVVASAVKVALEKGLIDENLPIEYIGIISGLASEIMQILFDSANEGLSGIETLDRFGRASTAAVCCISSAVLEGMVTSSSPAGPLLATLLGGLFEYLESPQCHESVYNVAQATANVLKEASAATVKGVLNSDIVVESVKSIQNMISN